MECVKSEYSSRVCEIGTKGCIVSHREFRNVAHLQTTIDTLTNKVTSLTEILKGLCRCTSGWKCLACKALAEKE